MENETRTPPQIVADAEDQSHALIAFIAQELESWGFSVDTLPMDTDADFAVKVTVDGPGPFRQFYVEVTPL